VQDSTKSDARGVEPRVLVITAYYKEERFFIERAIRSVARQTARVEGTAIVDHMLVADGFAQDWIDGEAVRHVRLDRGHGDYGNTPRGVGTLLGIVELYDAICYCDADNWYEPDHVATCLATAAAGGETTDYVIARRTMRRPDETIIPIQDEPIETHVDTNCFFFLTGSFPYLHRFAEIPREMSIIGDRIFFGSLKKAGLRVAVTQKPTVAYHCLWDPVYRAVGETPPPGSKPAADISVVDRWLASCSDRELLIASRLTGFNFGRASPAPSSVRRELPRVLVVSAYYKEDRPMLERCIGAVAAQTASAKGLAVVDHVMVADGFAQSWIDEAGLRHVRLDRAHGDYGNTPRGIGALLATAEGYDALCFLDADNGCQPDHVESCLARAAEIGPDCDWVMAGRSYRRPDWSIMPIPVSDTDIDTNCFFFLRGSFHLLHFFAQQPRELALAGDQIFHMLLTKSGLISGRVGHPTVDYLTLWRDNYLKVGETPPPGARPSAKGDQLESWLEALPSRRKTMVKRLIGMIQ
jgi:hypothetical protein